MSNSFFIIDKKNVFFENFADENVVVNITIGNYYSMKGIASFMWSMLSMKYSQQQLVSALLSQYDVTLNIAEDTVVNFLDTLQKEQLILTTDTQEVIPELVSVNTKKQFEKPVLEIYNDLQDILLLDPIHEVDEVQGWPTKK